MVVCLLPLFRGEDEGGVVLFPSLTGAVFGAIQTQKKGTLLMKTRDILHKWRTFDQRRYERNKIPEILYRLRVGELTRGQLVSVISVRYQVADLFEDMLEHMLRVIDKGRHRSNDQQLSEPVISALRKAVEENLAEERGEVPEYGGPHRDARKVFLQALGINYAVWKNTRADLYQNLEGMNENARYLVSQMRRIIGEGGVEAVSVLWYYENRISLGGEDGDYCFLLRNFERSFHEFRKPQGVYVEGDPFWHLYSHSRHDANHADMAAAALASLDGTTGMWSDSIDSSIQSVVLAIDNFWHGISDQLLGRYGSQEHWGEPVPSHSVV